MKFENLLDKREQMQVELLRRLIQTNGRTSIQKLALDCNISRPSLDTYLQSLEDLGSQIGKFISISRLENDVVLELDKRLSFNEIVEFLLLDATKYRFMKLLLESQELNMIDLSEKLLVSESTLFRKIKELNHDLKEFNLQIKNNKLIGNEEQIRYFYFLLFNGVQKGKRPAYLLRTEEKTKFILHAEESLRLSFSEVNKDQISCWLGIAEQRNKFTAIKKEFLLAQKQIYQNDHLYQLLDSLFYQEIYQNSDINHCETMLFYSFCVSFFILSQEDDYRFNIFRSKQIPAVMLNVTIREKMLAHYHIRRLGIADEKALEYQLAQVNNRYYFFTGSLTFVDQKLLLSAQEKMLKANLVQFLEALTFEATKLFKHPHQSISSILDLKFGYGNSLILLENYSAPTLIIQYDFSSTPTYQIALEQMLLNQLRSIESISLIPAKEGTFYDLLISSNRDDIREKITYLSEATPAHDVVKIKDKIDTLKRQKSSI